MSDKIQELLRSFDSLNLAVQRVVTSSTSTLSQRVEVMELYREEFESVLKSYIREELK
jgi:hypothetical protein